MSTTTSPMAGMPAPRSLLVDVPRLVSAYYTARPDPAEALQRVAFGTSGHRGSSLENSFNEVHVLAISQAICTYRRKVGIDGPLFIGFDTHALSTPAFASALEVMGANEVSVMISAGDESTPTPAISHAILEYNRGRVSGLADGIVITPSHNPPESGGFKYNPSNGGPAGTEVTVWIQDEANRLLESGLKGVKRIVFARARKADTTHEHDYLGSYVNDLGSVLDFDAIHGSGLRLGVDPLGGAGVHYWSRIAERYKINLDVISDALDPQFGFMSVDWDGRIRMDPSSRFAMQRLIDLKDNYDIAFACDTDHDRHGVVTPGSGLLPPNHYLAVMADYLICERSQWKQATAIGKTVVCTSMIDRVASRLGRRLLEVPVGFKWFAEGLFDGSLGFAGEESAGASFLRRDGGVWTTDKDGLVPALLSAEITARRGRDPGELYAVLETEHGPMLADRVEASANKSQKRALAALSPKDVVLDALAGDVIDSIINHAPGNDAAIGGIKVVSRGGWFAARPSGTEDIYKIYAESFRDRDHLQQILAQARQIVDDVIGRASESPP